MENIQEEISNTTFQRMRMLFTQYFEMHLGLSAEEIVKSRDVLEQRLNEVFTKYRKKGKIVLPPRPIKRITFTPELKIEFKNRDYGLVSNDPLLFFREHIDFYAGMTRTQLKKVDKFLYNSLRDKNKLDLAIPFVYENGQKKKLRLYRGFRSPLVYFRAHEQEFQVKSRMELKKIDVALYDALLRYKQLDQAIPYSYRGYPSPYAYFLAHPEKYKGISRTQLKKIDSGLYQALDADEDLDKAVHKRREVEIRRSTQYTYRGYESPFAYFCAHQDKFKGLSPKQLY